MEKELETLEMLSNKIKYKKEHIGDDVYRLYITEDALDFLEKALNELKQIKEAEPSKALRYIQQYLNEMTYCLKHPTICQKL